MKLYSSILLVGGGLSFPGSSKMLHSQLKQSAPAQLGLTADSIEVHSNVRVSLNYHTHVYTTVTLLYFMSVCVENSYRLVII